MDGDMNGDMNGDANGDATGDLVIRNNPDVHRFEAVAPDGQVVGYLAYDPVPSHTAPGHGMFVAVHTIIQPAWGDRGVASRLVRAALDHARSQHLTVIAECPFTRAFIERHAEYQDLVP